MASSILMFATKPEAEVRIETNDKIIEPCYSTIVVNVHYYYSKTLRTGKKPSIIHLLAFTAVVKFVETFRLSCSSLLRIFCGLEVPLGDLLEYAFTSNLNHISMARNDTIKVPLLDLRHALVESRPILS